jgi:hypothetical protein
MIHTAMQDWRDNGVDVDRGNFDLERITITADGQQWKVRERSHQSEFGNAELYMVLGLEHL